MYARQIASDDDTITIVATAAITAKRCVAYNGTHTASVAAMGVARFATDSGDPISVGVAPIEVIESGTTCTAGGVLKTDSVGRVVDQGGSGVIIGRAIDAAGATAGAFIRVRMFIQ